MRLAILSLLVALTASAQFNLRDPAFMALLPKLSAAPPASYDLRETFETTGGTGYDLGWTEVGDTAIIDPNSVSPALRDVQSVRFGSSVSFDYIHLAIAAVDTNYIHFRMQPHFAAVSQEVRMGFARIGMGDDFKINFVNDSGLKLIVTHGTTASASGTTTLSQNTTYYVWGQWIKGTGADGVARVWLSTTPIKPGAVECEVTNGNGTTQPTAVIFLKGGADEISFDDVIVDNDEAIGSNP